MPFGHEAGHIIVYHYGVPPRSPRQPAIGNRDLALATMRQRVQLWNQLVELERAHRERVEQVLREADPQLVELAEAVEAAEEGRERREAERAYRVARRATFARPEVRERVNAMQRELFEEARRTARESGLWWVNYEDVLAAWRTARARPGEPRFHRSGQDGKLLVRWQKGLPVADAYGRDRRMQIRVTGTKHDDQLATMFIRIASTDDGEPVWLELPVVLHRPLPADGVIRQVAVTWRRVATGERWGVSVAVEVAPPQLVERDGTVTVSLGWKRVPGGLRVATWQGFNPHPV